MKDHTRVRLVHHDLWRLLGCDPNQQLFAVTLLWPPGGEGDSYHFEADDGRQFDLNPYAKGFVGIIQETSDN